jgi:hypothetical protein
MVPGQSMLPQQLLLLMPSIGALQRGPERGTQMITSLTAAQTKIINVD